MKPSRDDVQQMVAALVSVNSGMERARRQGDASILVTLQVIAVRGQVRPSDIAAELGVHQSTITRQVRTLEAAGQVTVEADPADRRSCFIALTDAGRREIDRLTEIGLSRFALFVADWDAEEVRTLGRLLAKLERSKAAVSQREQIPGGRPWQKKKQ
jgi:DNA-binding MarR family transcriptional regulator